MSTRRRFMAGAAAAAVAPALPAAVAPAIDWMPAPIMVRCGRIRGDEYNTGPIAWRTPGVYIAGRGWVSL